MSLLTRGGVRGRRALLVGGVPLDVRHPAVLFDTGYAPLPWRAGPAAWAYLCSLPPPCPPRHDRQHHPATFTHSCCRTCTPPLAPAPSPRTLVLSVPAPSPPPPRTRLRLCCPFTLPTCSTSPAVRCVSPPLHHRYLLVYLPHARHLPSSARSCSPHAPTYLLHHPPARRALTRAHRAAPPRPLSCARPRALLLSHTPPTHTYSGASRPRSFFHTYCQSPLHLSAQCTFSHRISPPHLAALLLSRRHPSRACAPRHCVIAPAPPLQPIPHPHFMLSPPALHSLTCTTSHASLSSPTSTYLYLSTPLPPPPRVVLGRGGRGGPHPRRRRPRGAGRDREPAAHLAGARSRHRAPRRLSRHPAQAYADGDPRDYLFDMNGRRALMGMLAVLPGFFAAFFGRPASASTTSTSWCRTRRAERWASPCDGSACARDVRRRRGRVRKHGLGVRAVHAGPLPRRRPPGSWRHRPALRHGAGLTANALALRL